MIFPYVLRSAESQAKITQRLLDTVERWLENWSEQRQALTVEAVESGETLAESKQFSVLRFASRTDRGLQCYLASNLPLVHFLTQSEQESASKTDRKLTKLALNDLYIELSQSFNKALAPAKTPSEVLHESNVSQETLVQLNRQRLLNNQAVMSVRLLLSNGDKTKFYTAMLYVVSGHAYSSAEPASLKGSSKQKAKEHKAHIREVVSDEPVPLELSLSLGSFKAQIMTKLAEGDVITTDIPLDASFTLEHNGSPLAEASLAKSNDLKAIALR